MSFTWYIAGRYFRGGKSDSRFLSFIKIMAIGAVAVGSAGLLIAFSVVHGFKSTINEKIVGFAPHITVYPVIAEANPITRADTLQTYIAGLPGVSQAQPVVEGEVMIQAARDISGIRIKGVPESGDVTQLRTYITEGNYHLERTDGGLPGIILGNSLARAIGAELGSRVTVYALDGLPSPLNTPEIQQFTLTGIYQTGIAQFDDHFALVNIESTRRLFGMDPLQASTIEITAFNPADIRTTYTTVRDSVRFPYNTDSIYQRHQNMFAWVDMQEGTIPLALSSLVLIAALNLIGTVLMIVLERIKDIGILKTMGAKSRSVHRIFLLEGVFVAFVGLIIGIAISLLFYWLQTTWEIIRISEENYYMSTAPVEPHLMDFVIVAVVTMVLCTLASWLPARIAAKTDPLKVIAFGR